MASKSGKSTGTAAAKKASAVLRSGDTGKSSKSAAGSALAQKDSTKVTSQRAATSASRVLRDGRSSASAKSAAGSALSQSGGGKSGGGKGTGSGGPRKAKK